MIDRINLLASRPLPGGERTWLDLLQQHATAEGIALTDAVDLRTPTAVLVRARCFALLYSLGRSTTEIGRGFGRDSTSVLYGLKLLGVERRPVGNRRAA